MPHCIKRKPLFIIFVHFVKGKTQFLALQNLPTPFFGICMKQWEQTIYDNGFYGHLQSLQMYSIGDITL